MFSSVDAKKSAREFVTEGVSMILKGYCLIKMHTQKLVGSTVLLGVQVMNSLKGVIRSGFCGFPISFSLYTIEFSSKSNFLPLEWNIMYLVLERFRAILFVRNQFASVLISTFILVISSGRLSHVIKLEVSSANRKISNSVAFGRSFINSIEIKLVQECSLEVQKC